MQLKTDFLLNLRDENDHEVNVNVIQVKQHRKNDFCIVKIFTDQNHYNIILFQKGNGDYKMYYK